MPKTTTITNASLAAEALDFCIIEDCPRRCAGNEFPEGWAMFSIMRNDGGERLWQLGAALCPEHADELLQRLKPIRRTGTMVATPRETPQSDESRPRHNGG